MGEAIERLHRAAVLWSVGLGTFEPVVRAACDALVEGFDGEALAWLASQPVSTDTRDFETAETVSVALSEQERPLPPHNSDELRTEAVIVLASAVLDGAMTPRQMVRWLHDAIGHQGVKIAQPLVEMDDRYDIDEYTGETLDELDAETLSYCRSIVGA